MQKNSVGVRVAIATAVIVGTILYLAVTGVRANKSYYVTIQELQSMGNHAYSRHLRVAGNVEPGSIQRDGAHAQFILVEQGRKLQVNYTGGDPPPDTFKDNAQALAVGMYGRDGVFHASQIQAKCASKYAPAKPGEKPKQSASMASVSSTQ
ncbi:MAG TPA: cytochrome c maturation protein CcmE [Acidobacteriaceae bacterium]|nr:cytochrome c maturation protein CcmE [Acidobacteriaceae bacterium]